MNYPLCLLPLKIIILVRCNYVRSNIFQDYRVYEFYKGV